MNTEDIRKQQTMGILLLCLMSFGIVFLMSSSPDEQAKKQQTTTTSLLKKTKPFFEAALKAEHPNQIQLKGEQGIYFLSPKGARITKFELYNHKDQNGKPVVLHSRSSGLDLELTDKAGKKCHTYDLDFDQKAGASDGCVVFVHGKDTDREIRLTYKVKGNTLDTTIKLGKAWNANGKTYLQEVVEVQNQDRYIEQPRAETYLYHGKKDGGYSYKRETRKGWFRGKDELELETTPYISICSHYFLQSIITNADNIKSKVSLKTASDSTTVLKTAAIRMAFPTKKLQKEHTITYYLGENTLESLQKVHKGSPSKKIKFENQYPSAYRWYFPFPYLARTYLISLLFNMFYSATNSPLSAFALMLFVILFLMTLLGYFGHIYKLKTDGAKPFINEIKAKAKDGSGDRMLESMLYKKLGINPLVLLLNAFVTLSLFLGMLSFLKYQIVFRGVSFLWVTDISNHDGLLPLPFHVPMVGRYITGFGLISLVCTLLFKEKTPLPTTPAGENKTTEMMQKMMRILFPILSFSYINTCGVIIVLSRISYTLHAPVKKFLFNRIINKKKIDRYIAAKIAEVKKEQQSTSSRALSRLEKRMKK